MLVRIFEQPDGKVSVMRPNPRLRLEGESEQAFVNRMGKKLVGDDPTLARLVVVDMDDKTLPQDRSSRNLWRLKDGKVE